MENRQFRLEVPVTATIIVSLGEHNQGSNSTPIEIKGPDIHIVFDLEGCYKGVVIQRKIIEAVKRLYSEDILGLADTRLGPVIAQIKF